MELNAKITDAGVFYVPAELRRAFGRELRIIPNFSAAVFFSRRTPLEHVLKSMEIIAEDLKHRIAIERENNPQGEGTTPSRPGEPPRADKPLGAC